MKFLIFFLFLFPLFLSLSLSTSSPPVLGQAWTLPPELHCLPSHHCPFRRYLTRRRRINAAAGAAFQPPSCRPRNYSRSAIRGPARLWRLRAQQHLRCLYVFAALLQPSCAAFTEGAGPSCCGCMTTPLAAAEHCCCGASAAWEAEPTTAAPDRQRRSSRTPVLAPRALRPGLLARRSVGPTPQWSPGLQARG